jgi:hypothetical protein
VTTSEIAELRERMASIETLIRERDRAQRARLALGGFLLAGAQVAVAYWLGR